MKRILTIALLLALAVSAVLAQSITEVKEEQPKSLTYTVAEDPTYGAYTIVESKVTPRLCISLHPTAH